ncbi:MAG TPA: winged helix-turn-helix domain-containing protein [Thermoanaerobaculia bacterium]|nr:winged helix-turn-helix domain-containing protein [Thermoanaerobaculia bacterium]
MAAYALGSYVLDVRAGELRRGASAIALAPKVFELLVYLVENHGRLVRHDELLDTLWPSTDVGAGSLTRAVADLRRALDDDAAEPQYVQTVPRRGYRLIAPVHEVATEDRRQHAPFCLIYKSRAYALRVGDNVIGRSEESVVPIQSPAVSRRHATVIVTESGAMIRDLESKNGTFVGQKRVMGEAHLAEGDELRVGPIRLAFVKATPDPSTITEHPSPVDR